jgi:uroporphyrinogen decarboxylase-like protein
VTHLERFYATMRYESVDRGIYRDVGYWPETLERWRREGYDPDKPPFEVDVWPGNAHWFFPRPPFSHEVVEEDERTVTYINHEGILMRERKDQPWSSMPQFVRFPVETREDFRTFWRERMQPDLQTRIGPDWKEQLHGYAQREAPFHIIADRWGGFFGPLRNLLGVEALCMAFYTDPPFVEEMLDTFADFQIAVMDQILDHTTIEIYGFWEDMAFKTGPLLGPEQVRQYMLPRYRRVVEHLRGRGVEFFSLDSDGDISLLIPIWRDAGINILYPFEVQCGMDVNAVRREYGRELRLCGGIDKRVLAQDRAAIDADLERVRPLIEDGGYVPGPDHSMPPDVPYANYCYFMERLWEVLSGR